VLAAAANVAAQFFFFQIKNLCAPSKNRGLYSDQLKYLMVQKASSFNHPKLRLVVLWVFLEFVHVYSREQSRNMG